MSTDEPVTEPAPTLLDDFLSGEVGRVLHATWETIASRDPAVLDALVPHAARIRRATEGLPLGGLVYANSANVAHALDKLERYRRGACWCENYPGLLGYDPTKEQHADHVRILSTSEPGWSMTYVCECAVCGQLWDVEQGDQHVTWWRWRPRGGP